MSPHRRIAALILLGAVGAYSVAVGFAVAGAFVPEPSACGCAPGGVGASTASLGRWLSGGALLALLGLGVAVVLRTVTAVRRADRSVRAARVGRRTLAGSRVQLTPGREARAFCVGALRPGTVVTAGFLRLPYAEQRAVLAHERSHARFRDPLVFALLDALAALVPPLRPLAVEFRRQAEFAADDAARAAVGDAAFAAALAKGIEGAPIGASFSPTEARVRRFLGHPYAGSLRPLLGSALALAVVLVALGTGALGTRRAVAEETRWCATQPVFCRGAAPLRSHPRADGTTVLCRSTADGTVCVVR